MTACGAAFQRKTDAGNKCFLAALFLDAGRFAPCQQPAQPIKVAFQCHRRIPIRQIGRDADLPVL
jgi:hypothetical protein